MVYVLVQWTRDTHPKAPSRREDRQARDRKEPHIVGSHKTSESGGSFAVGREGQSVNGEQGLGRLSSSLDDAEDIARRRIASFVVLRKKT